MNVKRFFIVIEVILLALCLFPEMYREIAMVLFAVSLLRLLHKIGNGSFFLELIYVYSVFTCVLMPLIGYIYFPRSDELGKLWVRYMPISEQLYFSFNLPAVIVLGFGFFAFRKSSSDESSVIDPLMARLRKDVLKVPVASILTLSIFSLVAYGISNFLPAALRQVNTFLYYSFFSSIFYIVFFKGFPFKRYFIIGGVAFILFDAFRFGMFTIMAYMSGLFMILLLAGKRVLLSQKLILLVIGIAGIAFLQLYKLDLRRARIKGKDPGMIEVASRVVSATGEASFKQLLFPMYYRMNQGFNIALVQKRIPDRVDYLGGQYLALTFVSALVPRLFWPDKPEAGGQANMKLYVGVDLKTWSTNVGPIGEAYGNFGYFGGWIYIFFFGMFLRSAYLMFMRVCRSTPVFLLWLPPLFFQTVYVIETDSLQAVNSLVKGAIFLFMMYKLFPSLFPLGDKQLVR